MTIDGQKISQEILTGLTIKRKKYNSKIKLKIVAFENDLANRSFANIKKNFAEKLDILCDIYLLASNQKSKKIRQEINALSQEKFVKGVLVQLPIPEHLNKKSILNAIPEKLDIDCLSYKNLGRFFQGQAKLLPPTVGALDYLIKKFNLDLKEVLLVGQGELIGKLIATYLLNNQINFTSINKSSPDLEKLCSTHKTIITGVGKANLIKASYLQKDGLVFDFGCSKTEKICGDCENTEEIKNKCSFFTPVPHGLGPIVVTKLFENLLNNL